MGAMGMFVFGLGYSTSGIARQAQQHEWRVTSTARQPNRFAGLQSEQHRVLHFDPGQRRYLDNEGLEALQSAMYVLSSIPPVATKLYDPVLNAQHKALQQAVEAGAAITGLGYLSSTGVYGDYGGDWVDESSETRTATVRGLLRLEAEQAWVDLAQRLQLPLTIFRLGGIYGPRRSVLDNLQSQGPRSANAARRGWQRFTSRCHVVDVAQAVLADMQRRTQKAQHQIEAVLPHGQQLRGASNGANQGGGAVAAGTDALVDIVNVVDDEPAPRTEVEAFAQQLLIQGRPADSTAAQLAKCAGSDSARQGRPTEQRRLEPLEEKRVRNAKLKQLLKMQLGADLCAPTYKEGLHLIMHQLTPFEQDDIASLFQ